MQRTGGTLFKFFVQTRAYRYTKHGELISKPSTLKSQILYHPVLGEYQSEILIPQHSNPYNDAQEANNTNDNSRNRRNQVIDVNHVAREKSRQLLERTGSHTLLHALKHSQPIPHVHHHQKVQNHQVQEPQENQHGGFELGSLLYIRRSHSPSSPSIPFIGLLIAQDLSLGDHSWIRVRSISSGIGVELKIPLKSPYLKDCRVIVRRGESVETKLGIKVAGSSSSGAAGVNDPTTPTTGMMTGKETEGQAEEVVMGDNLYGVRESLDRYLRWVDPVVLTDKGRQAITRYMEQTKPVSISTDGKMGPGSGVGGAEKKKMGQVKKKRTRIEVDQTRELGAIRI